MSLKFDYADMSQVAKEVIFVKKKFPDFDYIKKEKNSCQKLLLHRKKSLIPDITFPLFSLNIFLKLE